MTKAELRAACVRLAPDFTCVRVERGGDDQLSQVESPYVDSERMVLEGCLRFTEGPVAVVSAGTEHAGDRGMKTMTRVRQSTAARTRGTPVPEAFAAATIATALRTRVTPRDARRAADKAVRVLAALAALASGACGGATDDAAARYADAICACGGNHEGCFANAYSEARNANSACLDQWAAVYEASCTGRPAPGCTL